MTRPLAVVKYLSSIHFKNSGFDILETPIDRGRKTSKIMWKTYTIEKAAWPERQPPEGMMKCKRQKKNNCIK